jgi:hypothetical protein
MSKIENIDTPFELIICLTEPEKRVFCLMQRKYLEALLSSIPISVFELDADTIGRREIVLISNHKKEGKELL